MRFYLLLLLLSLLDPRQGRAQQKSALNPDCMQNALIIPPVVDDPNLSDWLSKTALNRAGKSGVLNCLRVIDTPQTRNLLSYVGYSAFRNITVKKFRDKQLSYFVDEHKISRLIFLSYHQGEQPNVQGKVYRIDLDEDEDYYTTLVKRFRVNIKKDDELSNRSPTWKRYIPFLAPNAISFGATTSSVAMSADEAWEETGEEHLTLLPAYLSSFSVSRIAHPDSYNNWDYSLDISPRLMFFALNQRTSIRRKPEFAGQNVDDLEKMKLHVMVNGGCTTFDGTASLYSWIGTTYLALGFGPCLYSVRQESDIMKTHGDIGTRVTVGHTVFLSKRIYANLDISVMSFGKKLYHNEFAKSSSVTRTSLAVGYYFPDSENWLSRLF